MGQRTGHTPPHRRRLLAVLLARAVRLLGWVSEPGGRIRVCPGLLRCHRILLWRLRLVLELQLVQVCMVGNRMRVRVSVVGWVSVPMALLPAA